LKAAGLVEFVDFATTPAAAGTSVKTVYFGGTQLDSGVFHTILTSASIKDSFVSVDQSGRYQININLNEEGTKILTDFTSQDIGSYLCIVADKVVIWTPMITSTIPDGKAVINGQFTQEEVWLFSAILKSGLSPIPLK
jgi:preprotein translocase subunit SecD